MATSPIKLPDTETIESIVWSEVVYDYLMFLPDKEKLDALPDEWKGKRAFMPFASEQEYIHLLMALRVSGGYPTPS